MVLPNSWTKTGSAVSLDRSVSVDPIRDLDTYFDSSILTLILWYLLWFFDTYTQFIDTFRDSSRIWQIKAVHRVCSETATRMVELFEIDRVDWNESNMLDRRRKRRECESSLSVRSWKWNRRSWMASFASSCHIHFFLWSTHPWRIRVPTVATISWKNKYQDQNIPKSSK